MRYFRPLATAVILGYSLLCFAGAAHASSCTIPTSTPLNVLPAGCAAVLTNGPVTFTDVRASNGDRHNFEIDSLRLSDWNGVNSARLVMQGVDRDVTAGTTTGFNFSLPNIDFEVAANGVFPPDGAPHTLQILHFIASFPGGVFKLNFGEAGRPQQDGLAMVTSSATTSPGFFTVSSFFDIFTELSLDGDFNGGTWRVADNDFVVGSNIAGPGSILEFQSAVPEPASLMLFGTGIATLAGRRFRRR